MQVVSLCKLCSLVTSYKGKCSENVFSWPVLLPLRVNPCHFSSMEKTLVKCLFFVLDNSSKCYALMQPRAVEDHSNVCSLFTQNHVTILKNGDEDPVLQEALKCNHVAVLELIAINSAGRKCLSTTTPFSVAVEVGNEDIIQLILGKGADIDQDFDFDFWSDFKTTIEGNSGIIERLLRFSTNIRYRSPLGGTLLHFAIRRQNTVLVQLLLKHGANIAAVSKNESTALHLTVEKGGENSLPIANMLLKHGAVVDARRIDGSTSLLLAAKHYILRLANLLLKHEANVLIGNHEGLTPLHLAVKVPDLAFIKGIVQHGAKVNSTLTYRHAKGVTPLCLAVEIGCLKGVKYLLEKGADPTIPCYDDQTVLQLAVERERVDIVECILRYHPRTDKVSCKVFQKRKTCDEIAKVLIEHGITVEEDPNGTELHDAICRNDYAAVKQLVESGKNVNEVYCYKDQTGSFKNSMPLSTAVCHNANDIVKLLINDGADPHARLNDGETPLTAALNAANVEAAMILLAENVDFSDKIGSIALMAIRKDRPELLEEVLQKGARLNGCCLVEYISAMYLADKVSLKLVKVLVKFGALTLRRPTPGDTALHAVSGFKNGLPEVVRFVVQNNADVESQNCDGQTPILHAIVCKSNIDVIVELLKYGARLVVTDGLEVSPFYVTVYDKREELFETLLQFHFSDTKFVQRTKVYQLFNMSYIRNLRRCRRHTSLYNLYCDNFRLFLQNLFDALARHMIKLKAAFPHNNEVFDFCSENNLRSVLRGEYAMPPNMAEEHVWLDFKSLCENEMEQMKTHTVGESCASYYDILTRTQEKVSCYLHNALIFETLSLKDYEAKFPIYAKVLFYQFEKGRLRRELLHKSIKNCHLLARVFRDLPLLLKEKILSYLSTRELEVAVYACRCILNW